MRKFPNIDPKLVALAAEANAHAEAVEAAMLPAEHEALAAENEAFAKWALKNAPTMVAATLARAEWHKAEAVRKAATIRAEALAAMAELAATIAMKEAA